MSENKYPIGGYAPGNYINRCCDCGQSFKGDKRAVQCETCATYAKEKYDALSPEEQAELIKRNAEAAKEMFSKWNKSGGLPPLPEPILTDKDMKDWDQDQVIANQAAGAVWVKAESRVPSNGNLYFLRFATKDTKFKTVGYYFYDKWYRQDNTPLDWHPNLEWWDESTPAAAREEDWISIEDRPLIKRDGEFWELTEDGEKEFIAAVPYHDAATDNPRKERWWIRHCYIDGEGFLYVKRDNEMDEDVAGWNVSDITHWRPLPDPPKFKQQKEK